MTSACQNVKTYNWKELQTWLISIKTLVTKLHVQKDINKTPNKITSALKHQTCTVNVTKSRNGEWRMGSGEWGMENEKWEMGNEEWEMRNGK